jgi:hypothetical protein
LPLQANHTTKYETEKKGERNTTEHCMLNQLVNIGRKIRFFKGHSKPGMMGTSIIPTLWRLRQEGSKLEASLDYTVKPCLKKKKRKK